MPETAAPPAPMTLQTMVYATALALMLGWFLYMGSGVLVPMVLGLMAAYLVLGVSSLIGRIPGLRRWVSPGWRHVASALLIGYGLVQVVFLFAASLTSFAARAPDIQRQLVSVAQSAATSLGLDGDLDWEVLRRDVIGQINLQALLHVGLSSTATLLGGLVIVLLNTVFMLLEQGNFKAKLGMMSDDPSREVQLRALVANIHNRVGNYLAVKTLINVALGLVCYVILRVFGLEFAALLAIVIGLLNYIPYVGTWIGVGFPVILSVVQFGQIEPALMLLLVLSLVQFLLGSVIEPFVMGNSLDLSPYAILISLTVWASLWGVAGAIASVPITAVIMIILSEFPSARPLVVLLSRRGGIGANDADIAAEADG